MRAHPAADAFPMFDATRLDELVDDIKANGVRVPVVVWRDQLLDGRNRVAACERLGIEPPVQRLPDDANPWAVSWSLNGPRRDMSDAQRFLIWKDHARHSVEFEAELQRVRDEANAKRAKAQAGNKNAAKDKENSSPTQGGATVSAAAADAPKTKGAKSSKTAETKAAAAGVGRGTVEKAEALAKARPDLAEAVKTGEKTLAAATREMKKAEVKAKLESTSERAVKAAQGVYDVIVVDPPWPMKKIERDERPNQVEFDYPTMTEVEMAALPLPAAEDCHVWVWTTHKYLPAALRLLTSWGLKYVCTFVWHKPGGPQPFELPQYNCEFALYARRGAPSFTTTKALPVCFDAPRGKHSEKPAEFYDMVSRVTAGRRLDMFNRRAIPGFDGWGHEAA